MKVKVRVPLGTADPIRQQIPLGERSVRICAAAATLTPQHLLALLGADPGPRPVVLSIAADRTVQGQAVRLGVPLHWLLRGAATALAEECKRAPQ